MQQYVNHHISRWLNSNESYTILDAGMGYGSTGFMLRLNYPKKKMTIYGYDVFEEGMEYARKLGVAYDGIKKLNLGKEGLPHRDKSADIGISVGVLAHLTKDGGYHLLSELKRVCDHCIVTAPTVLFQHESLCNDPKVEPLRHKSAWSYRDFKRRGFNVRGLMLRWSHDKQTVLDSILSPWSFVMSAIHPGLTYFSGTLIAWV